MEYRFYGVEKYNCILWNLIDVGGFKTGCFVWMNWFCIAVLNSALSLPCFTVQLKIVLLNHSFRCTPIMVWFHSWTSVTLYLGCINKYTVRGFYCEHLCKLKLMLFYWSIVLLNILIGYFAELSISLLSCFDLKMVMYRLLPNLYMKMNSYDRFQVHLIIIWYR